MYENNDESVLRRRMREVRIDEAKNEFGTLSSPQNSQPKFAGLSLLAVFSIVLAALTLVVVVLLAFLPPK